MTITQARKQANAAPKYVLQVDGLNLFLSDKQNLSGCNLTENIKEAREFAIGFDNEEMKVGIWSASLRHQCNNKEMNFKAMYL